MRRAGVTLAEEERAKWNYIPFETVGPLRFGMTHDEAVATLGEVHGIIPLTGWVPSFKNYRSHSAIFYETAVTTYYGDSGLLSCVAIDALHGPQVTLDGIRLVGRAPSEVAHEFSEYAFSHDVIVVTSYQGDPGADEFGILLRAQRCGDVLLTRPVFVAREWADSVADVSEGSVPQAEWMGR